MVVSIVLPDSSPTFQDGLSFKTRKWRWSICHDPQVTGLRVRAGRLYEGPAVVKFDVLGSGALRPRIGLGYFPLASSPQCSSFNRSWSSASPAWESFQTAIAS